MNKNTEHKFVKYPNGEIKRCDTPETWQENVYKSIYKLELLEFLNEYPNIKEKEEKLTANIEMKFALENLVQSLSQVAFKHSAPIAKVILQLGMEITNYRTDTVGNYNIGKL